MGKELPDPFNCRCHHHSPNEASDRTFHRLRYRDRNAGSSTVFCASAPSHQSCAGAPYGARANCSRDWPCAAHAAGTCQAIGKYDRSVARPARASNSVKLESLAAMMRAAAAAIQVRPNLLYAAAVTRHADRKKIVSSRTDTEQERRSRCLTELGFACTPSGRGYALLFSPPPP